MKKKGNKLNMAVAIVVMFVMIVSALMSVGAHQTTPAVNATSHTSSGFTVVLDVQSGLASQISWSVSTYDWSQLIGGGGTGQATTVSTTWYASNNSGNSLTEVSNAYQKLGDTWHVSISSTVGYPIYPSGFYSTDSPSTVHVYIGYKYEAKITDPYSAQPNGTFYLHNATGAIVGSQKLVAGGNTIFGINISAADYHAPFYYTASNVAGWVPEVLSTIHVEQVNFQSNIQTRKNFDGLNILTSETLPLNISQHTPNMWALAYTDFYAPNVTFQMNGLPSGTPWSVTFNEHGVDGYFSIFTTTLSASSSTFEFNPTSYWGFSSLNGQNGEVLAPGTVPSGVTSTNISWSVSTPAGGWKLTPSSQDPVYTSPTTVQITASPFPIPLAPFSNVTFAENNLMANQTWNVSVSPQQGTADATSTAHNSMNFVKSTINGYIYTSGGDVMNGGSYIGNIANGMIQGYVVQNTQDGLLYYPTYGNGYSSIIVYKPATSPTISSLGSVVANISISGMLNAAGNSFIGAYESATGYTYIPVIFQNGSGAVYVMNGASVARTIYVRWQPDYIAVGGNYIYIADAADSGNVSVYQPSGNSLSLQTVLNFNNIVYNWYYGDSYTWINLMAYDSSNGNMYVSSTTSQGDVAIIHGTGIIGTFQTPVPPNGGYSGYYTNMLFYNSRTSQICVGVRDYENDYNYLYLQNGTQIGVFPALSTYGGYGARDIGLYTLPANNGLGLYVSAYSTDWGYISGYGYFYDAVFASSTDIFYLALGTATLTTRHSTVSTGLVAGSYIITASAGPLFAPLEMSITVSSAPAQVFALNFTQVKFPVTFDEIGLPADTQWAVSINGQTHTSISSFMTVILPAGNYTYTASDIQGYHAQNTGAIALNRSMMVEIIYQSTVSTYLVTFNEQGLPAGATWAVTFNGKNMSNSGSSISFPAVNGSYSYSIMKLPRYVVSPSSGTVSVAGLDQTVNVRFTFIGVIVIYETGLPNETFHSFHIGVTAYSTSQSSYIVNATAGLYNFTVANVNLSSQTGNITTYQPDVTSGYINLGTSPYLLYLDYKPSTDLNPVTFVEHGLKAGTPWTVELNGTISWSVDQNITYYVPNGQYFYTVQNITGYRAPGDPTMTVNGSTIVNVPFAPVPVAEMTYSSPIFSGTTEAFSAASSFTFVGSLTNYTWSFTGNAVFTMYGENVSARLSQGTYYVNLTVENSYNNIASTYATVYVYPAEASFIVRTNLDNGSAWLKSIGLSKNVSWTFTIFHGIDPARHFYLGNALPAADATEQNYTLQYTVVTQNASFSLLNGTFSYAVNLTHRFVLLNGSTLAHYPYGGRFTENGSSSINLTFGENIPNISISIPTYVPVDTAWSFAPNVTDYIGLNNTDPQTSITSIKYRITGPQDFNGTGSNLAVYFAKRGVYNLTITATDNWGYSRVFVSSIAVTAFTHVAIPIMVTRLNNSNGYLEYEMVVTTNLTISNVQLHVDNSSYVGMTFISQSHVSGNVYSYEYITLVNPRNFTYTQHSLNFSVYTTNGDYNWVTLSASFGSSPGAFNIIGAFGGLTNFLIVIFTGGGLAVAYAGVRTSKKGDVILRESNGKEQVIEAQNIQKKHRLFGNRKMKGRNGK